MRGPRDQRAADAAGGPIDRRRAGRACSSAGLLGRPRAVVVSYAIENLDPNKVPVLAAGSTRPNCPGSIDLALTRAVWRRVHRIAFGTAGLAGPTHQRLPAKTATAPDADLGAARSSARTGAPKDPGQVLFLGAFTDRKGFWLLTRAWPLVRDCNARLARLQLVGKGPLP